MTENIVYAKGMQPDNPLEWNRSENVPVEWKLDEYGPAKPGKWPIVVLVPGAGQLKAHWGNVPRMIAAQGAVVYSIDYPNMAPDIAMQLKGRGYREMADAIGCAIRFARSRATDSGNDTARLAVVGFSLGGGAAAQVALAGESLDRRWDAYAASNGGPPRQVGCEVSKGSTGVDALVGIAGAYDAFVGTEGVYGREWMQKQNPELWQTLHSIIGENPRLKVRLLHSKTDSVIPYENSVAFETPLAAAGYDVKLNDFTGDHEVPRGPTVETVMNVLGNEAR